MSDKHENWMRDLTQRLSGHKEAPVRNVMQRLGAVLHFDPVVFADNGLARQGSQGLRGRVTIITERFVAVAEAVDVAPMKGGGPVAESGQVNVQVVPRHALTAIRLEQRQSEAINTGAVWSSESARSGWPQGSELTLQYVGLDQPVQVPANSNANVDELVPLLLGDLASGSRGH